MTHKARWEYGQRAKGSEFIAILMVDWFSTGGEDEAVFVTQAKDTAKGSYMATFDGISESKRWQFVQLPTAQEMLSKVVAWQNGG